MSESLKNQPFIEDVSVSIVGEIEDGKYVSLTGEMLDVLLSVKTKENNAILRLQYIKELDYPLMYVEKFKGEYYESCSSNGHGYHFRS